MNSIIEVKIMCYDSELEEILNKPGDPVWLNGCIDVSDLVCVKEYVGSGEVDPDETCCAVYFKNGDSFVIDRPYNEFKEVFMNIKRQSA